MAADPARQMDPLGRSHRRLEYKAQHEGEDDRQDDLGCHITGCKHRQNKEAAQKYRIDIRWYRRIVFVSSRSNDRRVGQGTVSCVSARSQLEFGYCCH
jgi:hypothetical protein